ncbi:hypothetical protein J6590_068070 [Homalodisca vitripennis]|nr:hypothetical protein J6590_068070 [Homalodisca vitripennis]
MHNLLFLTTVADRPTKNQFHVRRVKLQLLVRRAGERKTQLQHHSVSQHSVNQTQVKQQSGEAITGASSAAALSCAGFDYFCLLRLFWAESVQFQCPVDRQRRSAPPLLQPQIVDRGRSRSVRNTPLMYPRFVFPIQNDLCSLCSSSLRPSVNFRFGQSRENYHSRSQK